MSDFDIAHSSASGRHRRYSFLAQRFDAYRGFRPGDGESWIGWVEPHPTLELFYTLKWMFDGWYTGLWRSAADRVYVSESSGKLFVFERPDAEFRIHEAPAALFGVYGRDDGDVYAFGERGSGAPACFRFDGHGFAEMPAPPFAIDALFAATPTSALYAAGGGLARFDGTQWHRIVVHGEEPVSSVFVAADGSVFAGGRFGGIYGGTDAGLHKLGEIPGVAQGDVQAVARYRGELWVAASRLGIWKQSASGAFESYKPKLDAVSLDVRDGVVVACRAKVSSSDDGLAFRSMGTDHLLTSRADKRLCEP